MSEARCDRCGETLHLGDFPFCPHGSAVSYRPFVPYFDIGLGRDITSPSQRNKVEHEMKVEPYDPMPKGKISARRDRIRDQKRYSA